MSVPRSFRKGWCPGALRPMESGDGLLVRLRIAGGVVPPDLGHAVARCARDFGSGLIDLTSRGNLQLRGVAETALPALQERLDGLGLLDASPASEAVRNILGSPLAGVDPDALCDIRPALRALDERLRKDVKLHDLPGKFGFLIDDGGRLTLAREPADIGFFAFNGGFEIRLAGTPCGQCEVSELSDVAAKLSLAFLQLRGTGATRVHRMAGLVARLGAAAVSRAAGIAGDFDPIGGASPAVPRAIGLHLLGHRNALGLGIAFGRLDAPLLSLLAEIAEAGRGELRLTPWRAILIVGEGIAEDNLARLAESGVILDENAPLRAIAACPGRPHCRNGATEPQIDGVRLAPLARRLGAEGVALHISGCGKGCAHPRTAPVTLVGREGLYDLVLDGRPGDTPMIAGLDQAELDIVLMRLGALSPQDREKAVRQFSGERNP